MQHAATHPVKTPLMSRPQMQIVLACTIGNILGYTPTVSAVFSLFLVPISEEFGWPRATVSGVLALVAVLAAIVYPIAGRITDLYGSRTVLIIGMGLFGPAVAALSLANGAVWQFYLLFAIVGVFGAVCATPAFSKVVTEWFDEKRGFALGFTAGMGNGIGSTIMPIIAGLLLVQTGWRGAYIGIGAIIFLVGVPTLLVFLKEARRHKESAIAEDGTAIAQKKIDPADLPGFTLAQAFATPTFWLVLVAIGMGAGCVTAIFTHVVPMITDRGFSLGEATAVLSTFAMVGAIWQVVTGMALDRFYTPKIVAPMFLAAVGGLLLIEYGETRMGLFAGGALMGIGLGAEYGCLPFFLSRYFGPKAYGAIIGFTYSVVMLATGITPVLMDLVFDASGSYRLVVTVMSVLLCGGAALILMLPPFDKHEAAHQAA